MSKKLLFIFFSFCLFYSAAFSQDPIFSQFYANKLYLNPAFTGFHLGTVANLNYRSQWAGVRSGYSKFETKSVGVSTILPCYHSGFGLTYNENVQGEGYLKWQSVGLSYAYHLIDDHNRKNTSQLAIGFGVSHNWRSVNWNNFVFGDQLNALEGIVGPSAYTPPASMTSQSKGYWDLNVGTVYMVERIKSKHTTFAEDLRMGIAINHLVRNNTTLLGYKEYLPMRFTGHISWLHALNDNDDPTKKIYLNPMIRYDYQKPSVAPSAYPFMSVSYGLGVMTSSLYGGFYMQNRKGIVDIYNTSSLVTQLGYGWETEDVFIRFGVSKDFNLTGFTNYGGGAWEASLIINPKQAMICNPNSMTYKRRMQNQCHW